MENLPWITLALSVATLLLVLWLALRSSENAARAPTTRH